MFRIGKSKETESRLMVTRDWGRGNRTCTAKGYRVSFGGDESVLKLDSGDGYTIL